MVNIDNKVIELIKFLPHGSKKIIAQKAGVSQVTVKKFFDKKQLTYKKGKAIFLATLEFYQEVKEMEADFLKAINGEQKEIEEINKANSYIIK